LDLPDQYSELRQWYLLLHAFGTPAPSLTLDIRISNPINTHFIPQTAASLILLPKPQTANARYNIPADVVRTSYSNQALMHFGLQDSSISGLGLTISSSDIVPGSRV
jgi:hypothetical protein